MPDSAATGSAWSTGTKTYDNAVSVDIHGTPQQTLLELAKANGLKTGDVTTSEIQDATPAVQVSHISARSCYGPDQATATCTAEAKENGGLGSITEQLLDTRPDVTLGGGATTFAQTAKAGQLGGQDAHPAGTGARLPAGRATRPGSRASAVPTSASRSSVSSRPATCRCGGSGPRRRRVARSCPARSAPTTRRVRRPSRPSPR